MTDERGRTSDSAREARRPQRRQGAVRDELQRVRTVLEAPLQAAPTTSVSGGILGGGAPQETTLFLGSIVDRTVDAEGPGPRFVIWTQGCSLGCPGCCNPHLWNPTGGEAWTVADLLDRIEAAQTKHGDLEGITLVGGEPFEQDAPLAALCEAVRERGLTVFAFSGQLREELEARGSALLEHCDLLVDGLFVEAERTTDRRWIGSNNQRLHFLTDAYVHTDPRFSEPNQAEIRYDHTGAITVVGFPFDSVLEAFGPQSEAAKASRKLKLAGENS